MSELIDILKNTGKILFTEKELEQMGFGKAPTLRNNRHRHVGLPFVRVGKRSIRYHKDDLIRHLKENRVEPKN